MKRKIIITILLSIIIFSVMFSNNQYAINKKMLGDINQDNVIDERDQLLMMRHINATTTKINSKWILSGEKLKIADMTQNGIVDGSDMLKILRYIAARKNPERIGNKHKEWLKIGEIDLDIASEYKIQEIKQEATINPKYETETEQKQDQEQKTNSKQEKETKIELKEDEKIQQRTIEAKSISLTQTSTSVQKDITEQNIAAIINPVEATDTIEWINNNQNVISIEKVIEEGTYYIKSGIDNNKVIEIKSASTANQGKVQIYKKNNSTAQQFEITSVGDGYYTIKAKCSDKMLDVENSGKTSGTIVQQYSSNGSDAQEWGFEYAGNDYYYIKSKCNGLYLDVKNGKTDNGTQIQVYTENRSEAQKFKLELIKKKAEIVKEGQYYIKTAINQNMVLDIKGASTENKVQVQIYKKNESNAQQFELINIGNNYYVIRAKFSNKVLDVQNASQTNGTIVQQYSFNGTNAQQWKIESAGNGYYYIKSKCNGLYLDVKDGKDNNGTKLQVYTGNKSNAQKFKFEKISDKINKNISIITVKSKINNETTGTIKAKTTNGKTATCNVTVEKGFPNDSARIAYQRIKNMSSSTKYLVAIDYDRNYMHVFKGKAGSWNLEKSFRCVTGPKRYFGDEKKRMTGTTPMMKSKLRGKFKYASDNPGCIFCVAMNSPGICRDYIHGYISPGIKGNASPYTYGTDIAAKRIATGKLRASQGCIELIRKDAIWFYENAAIAGTTCYVWTEKPATSNDRFENSKLKSVMIKKGYSDVSQLTSAEKSYVYK